ncbi:MAG: DUF190 domain-containing protein [Phascolarctobacterium sp.]|uniref:DUF190 domain-containing protein n=1 Tax=Phascolarctobacterium sp. TaxID=2049039 RepID=UPI0026DA9512|nr:DUF190 domain-containing protein [Phascolarctobacterium sp.]MDO4920346.1 DUF190 domain-containing protein [Phascolarctobacterium sp.]
MEFEFNKTTFLKVYTGEDVLYNDVPLYKAILREAHRLGLAGGTVIKGVEGFATKMRGVGRAVNTLISGNANLPVMVEIVDSRENIDKILPFLEKNATNALVTIQESTFMVTDYMRKRGYADRMVGAPPKTQKEIKLAQQNLQEQQQQQQ